MKIRFLSETSLDTLTQNIDSYLHFFNESDNHGLLEALESDVGDKPLIESNYLISDSISLDPTLRGGDEVSNIKKLYSELKTLPRSIACDGRIHEKDGDLRVLLLLAMFSNISCSKDNLKKYIHARQSRVFGGLLI